MIESLIFQKKNFTFLWGHNMCIFHTNFWGLCRSPQNIGIVQVNAHFWGLFWGDSKKTPYSDKSPLLWCVFISKYPLVGWGKHIHTYIHTHIHTYVYSTSPRGFSVKYTTNNKIQFYSWVTKIKTMFNLLRPLLIVNMRIPVLIWRGTAYLQHTVLPVAKQILKRKWGWIGHTLRKPASSITCQALNWNPQGKRKRGRPCNSWRQDTEAELKQQGYNWTRAARTAQNRVRWQRVVDGLCSTGSDSLT